MMHRTTTLFGTPRRSAPTTRRRHAATALLAGGAIVLTLTACGGGAEPSAEAAVVDGDTDVATRPAYGLVTPQQAAELATDSDITVIDVRTPEEFAEGHIEGAMMIDFSAPDFADRVAELDPEQEYLVYCRSGNRSGQAVAIMRKLGFDRVFDMEGGTVAYAAAGLPLTT
jgi:phage shock protein E